MVSLMKPLLGQLKGKKTSELSPDFKINCFTTVVSYFENKIKNGRMSAQEMEHAAIFISESELFQKASPSDEDPFEIINFKEMINKTYKNQNWVKYSYHTIKNKLL